MDLSKTVIVMTPMRNAVNHLDRYFRLLQQIDSPKSAPPITPRCCVCV